MTVDELSKNLKGRGIEAQGNKEAMTEALVEAQMQEEAVEARKAYLASMPIPKLKELLVSHGMDASQKKEYLISAVLEYEAKCLQKQRALAAKGQEVLEAKKHSLMEHSAADL